MVSRRKFLIWGGLAAVGATAATVELLPLPHSSDGELRLHLRGMKSFQTKVPYDSVVKAIYPRDPSITIYAGGIPVNVNSPLHKGETLEVHCSGDELDLIVQVKRG